MKHSPFDAMILVLDAETSVLATWHGNIAALHANIGACAEFLAIAVLV